MDPVTHALSGAVIKNLGFNRRAALLVLVVAAVAPDLDFLAGIWGADVALRYHRGITHGVLFLLVVPLLVGLYFRKSGGFLYFWMLTTLGYGSHIALDLTNSYGTRLLAPLDWQRHAAGLTFMVEPVIIAGFAVSLLIARLRPERARAISIATAALLVLFLGVKQHYHEKTEEFLRASLDNYVIEEITPLPNDITRWWFIARNEKDIKTGFADLFSDTIYIHKSYPRQSGGPMVERSKQYGVVKNFLYFAKYPYPEVTKNGNIISVKWIELSCAYLQKERFTATLDMGKDGTFINSKMRI